jgi:hypothetical protein
MAEGSDNCAQFFAWVVEFEVVKHHGEIKLCDVLVLFAALDFFS